MENMAKTSILLIVALLIATFLSTGSVLAAETCQETCIIAVDKKGNMETIEILPDAFGQWPIVVTEPGDYSCGDLNNYPCLVWAYQCITPPCNNLTKVHILIPNCCDNPIQILDGSPEYQIIECDNNNAAFPNSCSGYEIRMDSISGSTPPTTGLFWFATQHGIDTNMIDLLFPTVAPNNACQTGIKGPKCTTPIPPVRVEPRVQCFQFIAETNNGPKVQTWYAEWDGTSPCAVDVWAATEVNGVPVPCSEVKIPANKLEGKELGHIKIDVDGVEQSLTEALTNNTQCNEGWLRFTDESGTNIRCYYSGGRRYCY